MNFSVRELAVNVAVKPEKPYQAEECAGGSCTSVSWPSNYWTWWTILLCQRDLSGLSILKQQLRQALA
jgi:hypothetical protein